MKTSRPLYLSILTLTESQAAQAQTSSGIDWNSICNTVSASLVQQCSAYVNQDGTFTQEGERISELMNKLIKLSGATKEMFA